MPAILEAADSDGELDEAELIGVIDRFALQHHLPDGKTVVDRFVASRPDLTAASRGRGLVRRSTATSCRSTSSSASLEADDRPSRTSQPQSRTKTR